MGNYYHAWPKWSVLATSSLTLPLFLSDCDPSSFGSVITPFRLSSQGFLSFQISAAYSLRAFLMKFQEGEDNFSS